jgi:bisphosphoglycerate-dependent phosphoglycerate mutase family 1
MTQPVRLVLLRHGQSEWNAAGIFAGWENAHLTAHGEAEAARAGSMLAEHGVLPAFVHTSLQHRAIRTADLALAAADRDWIPVRRSWRLNGRHYGALQGRNKEQVLQQYGERQFRLWRRSYDVAPPSLTTESSQLQLDDPRYAMLPPEAQPRAESLRDVSARLLPYWYDAIVPDLLAAVQDGYGTPQARPIRRATPAELRKRDFPAGSMGPKIEAVCRFTEATGKPAAIGRLADAEALLAQQTGTIIAVD